MGKGNPPVSQMPHCDGLGQGANAGDLLGVFQPPAELARNPSAEGLAEVLRLSRGT